MAEIDGTVSKVGTLQGFHPFNLRSLIMRQYHNVISSKSLQECLFLAQDSLQLQSFKHFKFSRRGKGAKKSEIKILACGYRRKTAF